MAHQKRVFLEFCHPARGYYGDFMLTKPFHYNHNTVVRIILLGPRVILITVVLL
jgi:hypothetical protein